MARLRHKPKEANESFKPIEISKAAISRMQEESNRVVANMKFQQQYEFQERQRLLSQLREDADYAERVTARDFKLQQEAARAEQVNRQLQAQTTQQQINIDVAAGTKAFEGLAKFSTSLSSAIEAENKYRRETEEWTAQVQGSGLLMSDETIRVKFAESQLDQREEVERNQVNLEEAQGMDPATVSMARLSSRVASYKADKANNNHMLGVEMPAYIANSTAQDQDKIITIDGKQMTIRTALANPNYINAVHDAYARKFINERNINISEREYNKTGIEKYMQWRSIQELQSIDKFVKTNNDATLERASYVLNSKAGTPDFAAEAVNYFRTVSAINGVPAALDSIGKLFTQINPETGEFRFSEEELAAIQTGDTTFGERKGRFAQAMLERQKAAINYNTTQGRLDAAKDQAYIDQLSKKAFEKINAGTFSKADAAEIVNLINENVGLGKTPAWLQKTLEQNTLEYKNGKETLETYAEYGRLGLLNQQMVNAAFELNYNEGLKLQKQLDSYNAVYKSSAYKEAVKSLEGAAGQQLGFLNPDQKDTAKYFLATKLEEELKRRIKAAQTADPNVNLDQLIPQLSTTIQGEVNVNDPDNKYYKGASTDSSTMPTFPGLVNQGLNATAESGLKRITDFDTYVRNWGGNNTAMNKALNTPYRVLTAEEGTYVLENFGKPGFKFPAMIDYIVSQTGGRMDPFVIANRALNANKQGKLEIPQITLDLNKEADPAFRQVLYNPVTGPRAKLRTLEQINARQTDPTRLQRPAVLRDNFKRSFTGALTYRDNPEPYKLAGIFFQTLGFKVAEHPAFGGVVPVHAKNSYHGYGEAFDVTHQTGEYNASIEKTRKLKEAIRSMGLFEEIIGPGDGDPDHETHLHLGGLMRPITQEDIDKLESLFK